MLYRWRTSHRSASSASSGCSLATCGSSATSGRVEYVVWDGGYRPATASRRVARRAARGGQRPTTGVDAARASRRWLGTTPGRLLPRGPTRRPARRSAGFPDHLRPFAEQAAWSSATLGVESARHVRRSWRNRRADTLAAGARLDRVHHRSTSVAAATCRRRARLGVPRPRGDVPAQARARDPDPHAGVRSDPRLDAADERRAEPPRPPVLRRDGALRRLDHEHLGGDGGRASGEFYRRRAAAVAAPRDQSAPGFAADAAGGRDVGHVPRHRFEGEPFVLSVSTIEIRKNHLLLAKIWTECIREGHRHATPRPRRSDRLGRQRADAVGRPRPRARREADDRSPTSRTTSWPSCTATRCSPCSRRGSRAGGCRSPSRCRTARSCMHSTDPAQIEASQGLMPALHPDDFVTWKDEIVRLSDDVGTAARWSSRSETATSDAPRTSTAPRSSRSWRPVARGAA